MRRTGMLLLVSILFHLNTAFCQLVCEGPNERNYHSPVDVELSCTLKISSGESQAIWRHSSSSGTYFPISDEGFSIKAESHDDPTGIGKNYKYTLKFKVSPSRAGIYQFKVEGDDRVYAPHNWNIYYYSAVRKQFEHTYPTIQSKETEYECPLLFGPVTLLVWKLNDQTISESSQYAFKGPKLVPELFLILKSPQFSEAGRYTCHYENGTSSETSSFVVGVRGTYAPLWPILGVVTEIFILLVIMFVSRKRQRRNL